MLVKVRESFLYRGATAESTRSQTLPLYSSLVLSSFHSPYPLPAGTKGTLCPMPPCPSSRCVRRRLLCRETEQLKTEVQHEEVVLSFESRGTRSCRDIEGQKMLSLSEVNSQKFCSRCIVPVWGSVQSLGKEHLSQGFRNKTAAVP